MTALLLLVVILGLLKSVDCGRTKGGYQVKFINITSAFNPKNSNYFNFAISPNTNAHKFDVQWNLSTNIPNKMNLGIEVFLKRGHSYTLIFPYDFDLCRLWDGFMSQTFARTWFKTLRRFGRFPTACPISKGHYFLKRMPLNGGSVPPVMYGGSFLAKIVMYWNKVSMKDLLFNASIAFEVVKG